MGVVFFKCLEIQNLLLATAMWVVTNRGDFHTSLGCNGSSSLLPCPILFLEIFTVCISPALASAQALCWRGPGLTVPIWSSLLLWSVPLTYFCLSLLILVPTLLLWPQPDPLLSYHSVSSQFLLSFFTWKRSRNLIPVSHLICPFVPTVCLLSCVFMERVKKPQPWVKATQ